jgi:hypothetical protein
MVWLHSLWTRNGIEVLEAAWRMEVSTVMEMRNDSVGL